MQQEGCRAKFTCSWRLQLADGSQQYPELYRAQPHEGNASVLQMRGALHLARMELTTTGQALRRDSKSYVRATDDVYHFSLRSFAFARLHSCVLLAGKRQPSVQNLGHGGVYWILLVNFALFVADHICHLRWVSIERYCKQSNRLPAYLPYDIGCPTITPICILQVSRLYLYHTGPRWWQYLTSAFCHGSWQHLSSNAFMLYVFGRIVEEEA